MPTSPSDRCPTCKRKFKRSHSQNARYWSLLHAMAEQIRPRRQAFAAESWHLWCKSKWLGCTDHVLPNGRTLVVPRSTADLDTAEFNDYMTAVEAWANEHGCFLEDMEGAV